MSVAVLYTMPRSVYHDLPGVECWGVDRDARGYPGPHPVVAHPPCTAWGRYWRHAGDRPGMDSGCGASAVRAVRRFGGVLEQPAHSRLWQSQHLPRPGDGPDLWGGYSVAIDQVDWGHPARKPTWLYCVGVELPPMPPAGTPTHCIDSKPGRSTRPDRLHEVPKRWRSATPRRLAEWLVEAARTADRKALGEGGRC